MIAVKRKELKLKLKKTKKESTENDQTEPKTDDQKKTDWVLKIKGRLSEFPGSKCVIFGAEEYSWI